MQAELDRWNGLNYCLGNNEINDKKYHSSALGKMSDLSPTTGTKADPDYRLF